MIVMLTAFISYFQKSSNQRIIDKLKSYSETTVKVIRENQEDRKNKFPVRVSDLVPGDVVEIKQGQRIHADIRIMKAVNFKIDISSFTVNFNNY